MSVPEGVLPVWKNGLWNCQDGSFEMPAFVLCYKEAEEFYTVPADGIYYGKLGTLLKEYRHPGYQENIMDQFV